MISTELGLSDEDEVRILDHFYEGLWSELTGEAMKYEHEDYEISRFVGEMLRHANCYRRLPMNAMGYSPYSEVLSITVGSLANKSRIEKKRVGVSRCNFPGFLRGTKARFVIIAKRQRGGSEPNYWTPWLIRVIEGHTIPMIN